MGKKPPPLLFLSSASPSSQQQQQHRRLLTSSNTGHANHHGSSNSNSSNSTSSNMVLAFLLVLILIVAVLPQYYLIFQFSSSSSSLTTTTTMAHHLNYWSCFLELSSHGNNNASSSATHGANHYVEANHRTTKNGIRSSPQAPQQAQEQQFVRLEEPIQEEEPHQPPPPPPPPAPPAITTTITTTTTNATKPEQQLNGPLPTTTTKSVMIPSSFLTHLFAHEPCLSYPFQSSACSVATHYWSARQQQFYQPQPRHDKRRIPPRTKSKRTAVICLFVKNELLYLNEFIDYHLAIGFDHIFVYDNSDDFNLQSWIQHVKGPETNHRLSVQHWAGTKQQVPAYQDCHAHLLKQEQQHTWMALLDVDERLILQDPKYTHIVDLLEDHCTSGSVSLYWYYFGHANQTRYVPMPLMQRFQERSPDAHSLYKSIGHVATINPERFHVHYMKAIPPATHHDLLNNVLNGKAPVPDDLVSVEQRSQAASQIAAIYHYWSKSMEEFVVKACWRGRPVPGKGHQRNCDKSYAETLAIGSGVHDSAAWKALQQFVPEYAVLD
ncbi:hypothetical protein ACA910_019567 [Epithemia clementina (nom. ined.)]